MIGNVNFTGRETLLTTVKNVAREASENAYVSDGHIFSKEAVKEVSENIAKSKMPTKTQHAFKSPYENITFVKTNPSDTFFAESAPNGKKIDYNA